MKEILFGTTNEAKIKQIRGALAPANIGVREVINKEMLPRVNEEGKTAIENAQIKALAYAKALGEPVFSMDNALYINGLSPEQQPGLNVRRMNGYPERSTDEQMLEYYSQLISSLGQESRWLLGIRSMYRTPEGKTWKTTIKSPRIFTGKPSSKTVEGYPLESIQIEPKSGKYISEMTQEEQDAFWQKAIGKPLLEFVQSVDL